MHFAVIPMGMSATDDVDSDLGFKRTEWMGLDIIEMLLLPSTGVNVWPSKRRTINLSYFESARMAR